jgi:hypothetical protein
MKEPRLEHYLDQQVEVAFHLVSKELEADRAI